MTFYGQIMYDIEQMFEDGNMKERKRAMAKKETYDAGSISVLEGLEAVRKRPGMYIGSVSRKGLNHLIYEIVDNAVDEHLAGYCSQIHVVLEKDGSCTVTDNGRGIPVDMHEKGMSAERLVFTTLHAGGKFDNSAYKTSGGLHGVGSSVVNALSTYLDIKVSRDGYVHHDHYERGIPTIELENGLAVVPSCLDLSAAESELINEPGRELILKGLIAKLLDSRKFDYILIDCPPSLGLLTLNALTTADFLIIPVQAQFLAMRGMAKITSVIEIVKERLNPNLSIGGIVITQFDKRKTLNKSVAEIINDSFCDKVFKTIVRDNVALAEAPIKGKNVFEYNKNCNGAKDYMALAQEVLKLK